MRITSPVGTAPEQVFADSREVAERVRRTLEIELDEAAERAASDEVSAERISRLTALERTRVLEAGAVGLEKLAAGRAEEIDDAEYFGVEAIVLLEGRPAVLIQDSDFAPQDGEWAVLDGQRERIRDSIARVGRVYVSGHASLDWVGTAFLVGPEVVMTNRHVAMEFARADGKGWRFQNGMGARVDPREEVRSPTKPDSHSQAVVEIVGVHSEADLALLRVEPGDDASTLSRTAVNVAAEQPASLAGREVYVIGYPAWDGRRNEPEPMRRIFMDVYNIKRLQPGRLTEFVPERLTVKHDCSTLGGNSGSPVFDLVDHRVLGLHFGGRYGVGNVAVPLWQLVDDPLLRRAEVNFA